MNFAKINFDFADLLRKRLFHKVFTSEDGVRYTYFASLLSNGVAPHLVSLEYPNPATPETDIDTVIVDEGGTPVSAIEFKYDRAIPSGSSQPRPQNAGAVFKDLLRLLPFPRVERFFVYVTDGEMAKYFTNRNNGLRDFFTLRIGQELQLDSKYFAALPRTFHESMGRWTRPAELRLMTSEFIPRDHYLRIFRIAPQLEADKA